MTPAWFLLLSLVFSGAYATKLSDCPGNLTLVGPSSEYYGAFLRLDQPAIAPDWTVTIQELQLHIGDDVPQTPTFTTEMYDRGSGIYTVFAFYDGLVVSEGDTVAYRLHLQATDTEGTITNILIPPTSSGMVQCTYMPDVVLSYLPSLLWRNLMDVVIALGVLLGFFVCGCAFCMWKRQKDRKTYTKQVRNITDGSAEAFGVHHNDKELSPISGRMKASNGNNKRDRSVSFSNAVEVNDKTPHHVIASAVDEQSDDEDTLHVTEFDRKDAEANRITDPRTPRSDRDIPFPVLSASSGGSPPPTASEMV